MRNLNEVEKEIINTLQDRRKLSALFDTEDNVKVQYTVKHNVTIAAVFTGDGELLLGYAKYNPYDKDLNLPFIPEVGERRAFHNALVG